jgi:hypothetical protein
VSNPVEQLARIKMIENLMSQICMTTSAGGYSVLSMTIGFFKNLIANPKLSPKNSIFTAEEVARLSRLGVTQEDLTMLEANRAKARDLVRESMILLYEKSNKAVRGNRAKEIILSIVEHQATKAEYLDESDIVKIASGNITCLDTSWVLHQNNVDGIEKLVKDTNLSIREAFDFFETLSHAEKTNINKILYDLERFITTDLEQLASANLTLDEEFEEINAVFAGKPSKHNRLQKADFLSKGLSLKFIKVVFSERIKQEIQSSALRRHLGAFTHQFLVTAAEQPPHIAKTLIDNLQMWINCKIANICPSPVPEPIQQLQAPKLHPATISNTLAKNILGMGLVNLNENEVAKVIDSIAADAKSVEFFQYDFFKGKISNTSDPAVIKALFTPEFKAELAQDLTYNTLYYQAQAAIVECTREALVRPLDIGRQFTNALGTRLIVILLKKACP